MSSLDGARAYTSARLSQGKTFFRQRVVQQTPKGGQKTSKDDAWSVTSLAALGNQQAKDALQSVIQKTPEEAWPILSGVAAFGATLALSTFTQLRLLGISTGTPAPIPTMYGVATVCAASLASHHAAIAVHQYRTTGKWPSMNIWEHRRNAVFSFREDYLDLKLVQIPLHTMRICAVGLLAFKLLGGRFWAISPSSYTDLGSFARPPLSIPASARYASAGERVAIERLGRRFGCHTCGSHMRFSGKSVRFVADHMPPIAVAEQKNAKLWRRLFGRPVSFRFFPQCVDCSGKQGSILAKATKDLQNGGNRMFRRTPNLAQAGGGRNAHYHGFRPRFNHLTGGIVGGLAVVGADEADIIDGNRYRYANLHRQVDQWAHATGRQVDRWVRDKAMELRNLWSGRG